MMAAMDRSVAWRSAVIFGVALAIVAVVLALALPRSFFEDWGWLAGPGRVGRVRAAGGRGDGVGGRAGAGRRGAQRDCRASPPSPSASTGRARRSGSSLFGAWCGWIADEAAGGGLMDLGLRDRVALVTGGSKGIGARDRRRAGRGGGEGRDRRAHARERGRDGRARGRDRVRVRLRRSRRGPRADRRRGVRARPDRCLCREHRRPADGTGPARVHARAVGGRAPHAGALADGVHRAPAARDAGAPVGAHPRRVVELGARAARRPSSSPTRTAPACSPRSRSWPAAWPPTASR